MAWNFAIKLLLLAATLLATVPAIDANQHEGTHRAKCAARNRLQTSDAMRDKVHRERLAEIQNMLRKAIPRTEAYLITSYDEHMSDHPMESDRRLKYLTGYSGTGGKAVVTVTSAALWVDEGYLDQASFEVPCEWVIFRSDQRPSIAEWVVSQLSSKANISADPLYVPHSFWVSFEQELNAEFIRQHREAAITLVQTTRNPVDAIWHHRRPKLHPIVVHPVRFAGERWTTKIDRLRWTLQSMRCDAMIVTSLTEVAYILNLRGSDLPYTPVFKAYLLVTSREIILYTNRTRQNLGLVNHLKAHNCHDGNCVKIKEYEEVWRDLRTLRYFKRILVPSAVAFDMGASKAIYATLNRDLVANSPSPIIFQRAQKNQIEREGMRRAHIRDAAAMCNAFCHLEQRFTDGEHFTEVSLAREIDRQRKLQELWQGFSFRTIVAFGAHSAIPRYVTSNRTSVDITNEGIILIDSGGQYQDGTTDVSRTIHLGEPSQEQMKVYTKILKGMIQLSDMTFLGTLTPAELDGMAKGDIWERGDNVPLGMGHGIGSYLSVYESPASVSYTTKKRHTLKDGYFFANEPGWYKQGDFGVRLENVLEVFDTGNVHTSGHQFHSFKDVTLVPFEIKLIDRSLLTNPEIQWLNDYNARIRQQVGDELKKQNKTNSMDCFYWMMNKTRHIPEHSTSAALSVTPSYHGMVFISIALIGAALIVS